MSSPKFRLWADTIHIDRQMIKADGDVLILQEGQSIYANHIIIDQNRKEIEAYDSVLAHFKDTFFSGDHLWFDLEKSTGEIHQGTLYYAPGPLYIKGNRIEKKGPDTYHIDDVQVTGCDICDPDWMISGKDVHVTIDGYATLWHGLMTFKHIPIFYTPFFLFPVKQHRQTGLLFPFVEQSSRKGWVYQQPLYWVINKNSDATFYTSFMEKRGLMNGIEFRYNIGPQSRGTLMMDHLTDRQSETQEKKGEWGYTHDDYLRQNSDRYWFRMKLDQSLFNTIKAELDIDRVSDQDYLKTFNTGYTGYEKSRQLLSQRHSRGIEDPDETVRKNRAHVHRLFEHSRIYGECRWYDDIYHRNFDTQASSAQNLPVIRFSKNPTPLLNLPILMDVDALYAYEYHENFSNRHQLFMGSGFSLPLYIIPQLYIEPSFQWKGGYSKDNTQSKTIHQKRFETHLTSELYKIYSFGSKHASTKSIKAYKHTIRLRGGYTYIPDDRDENDEFQWTVFDEKSNNINWLISNTWVEKSVDKTIAGNNQPIYKQRILFELSGEYNILEDREKDTSTNDEPHKKEPFSPITVDCVWNADYFQLDTDGQWSIYDNQWLNYHIAFDVNDQKDQSFKLDYQYTENQNESLNTTIAARLNEQFIILAAYEHDLKNDQRIQHNLGFYYQGPCWRLDGMFYDNADTNDQGFSVMMHLDGITTVKKQGADFLAF
ncbi:MAG: LPS-assembly protein LptD [Candidatus Magnetomorum sp.]|nr:LPS-assembly protein LptD [Candidatus Magnetomorum sp.]